MPDIPGGCLMTDAWPARAALLSSPATKFRELQAYRKDTVKLVIPKVTDVPKKVLTKLGADAAVGWFDNCVDEDMADDLIASLVGKAS